MVGLDRLQQELRWGYADPQTEDFYAARKWRQGLRRHDKQTEL